MGDCAICVRAIAVGQEGQRLKAHSCAAASPISDSAETAEKAVTFMLVLVVIVGEQRD